MSLRFKIEPGDVPPTVAARRLGLTLPEFELKLSELRERGFPAPDPTTGNYDLEAVDAWRRGRHPQMFTGQSLTPITAARDARDVVRARLMRQGNG